MDCTGHFSQLLWTNMKTNCNPSNIKSPNIAYAVRTEVTDVTCVAEHCAKVMVSYATDD